jgi:hypothetical protein
MYPGTTNYSRVIRTWLWLQPEELSEEDPVRLDPHEGFTEVDKDGNVEDVVGVQIEILDVVVAQHPIEEITGGDCESALDES